MNLIVEIHKWKPKEIEESIPSFSLRNTQFFTLESLLSIFYIFIIINILIIYL